MTITRFDPFRLLTDVYLRDEDLTARGGWVPPVDIFETDRPDLVIKVELPDVDREDVEVTVEHNTLTLKGEKKLPADVKDDSSAVSSAATAPSPGRSRCPTRWTPAR